MCKFTYILLHTDLRKTQDWSASCVIAMSVKVVWHLRQMVRLVCQHFTEYQIRSNLNSGRNRSQLLLHELPRYQDTKTPGQWPNQSLMSANDLWLVTCVGKRNVEEWGGQRGLSVWQLFFKIGLAKAINFAPCFIIIPKSLDLEPVEKTSLW